jgi:hypothetical protein
MVAHKLNRGCLNLAIDLAAGASLFAMMATGYILRFPLPPSTNRTHTLWGLSRHEWGSVHAWASMLLLGLLAVHLALHWEWLYGMLKRRLTGKASTGTREAARAGLTFLVVSLLASLGFAWVVQTGVRLREVPFHELRQTDTLPQDAPERPDFTRDIWPIFETACAGCHGPDRERAGFRADRKDDYIKARPEGALVVPGSPEQSTLLLVITGQSKHVEAIEAHRLPDDSVDRVRHWIAAGADWGT